MEYVPGMISDMIAHEDTEIESRNYVDSVTNRSSKIARRVFVLGSSFHHSSPSYKDIGKGCVAD